MKKFFYLLITALLTLSYACSDDNNEEAYKTYSVSVQLSLAKANVESSATSATRDNTSQSALEGIKVTLYDTNENSYTALTDKDGLATFTVPAGVYRASANAIVKNDAGFSTLYNWAISNITVTSQWNENEVAELQLTESTKGQVIIKELYVGGCLKNNSSDKAYHMDKYVILYNNSSETANLDNLCLGMSHPYNAQGTNNDYVNGQLIYENEGWIPAGSGIWYYPGTLTIEPYKEIVIALNNAIDNTATYQYSIDFRNPEYYCTYDMVAFPNTMYYSVPDAVIPTNHYWAAVRYALGNAWVLSNTSPAFFIFQTKNIDPVSFANDEKNTNYPGSQDTGAESNIRKKVPVEWILDGIEVFTTTSDKNQKRLTAKVDAGQTYLANQQGYTSYRNVDKESTEAIEGNKGKLVYNYSKGTEFNGKPSTDPNGIDAEASIKAGAQIVYMDTNNSTNDFHQRSQASLRD